MTILFFPVRTTASFAVFYTGLRKALLHQLLLPATSTSKAMSSFSLLLFINAIRH